MPFPLSHRELLREPPVKLDNTIRTMFEQCPRKYYWWARGYDYRQRPPYFVWGEAWHEIKRQWYASAGPTAPPGSEEWLMCAGLATSAGLKIWDDSGASETKNDIRRNLIDRFEDYLRLYPSENFHLVRGGAEIGVLWPLSGTPFFYGGSIDGYVDQSHYGISVLEEKSTSVPLSDAYVRQWSLASQITWYAWIMSKILGSAEIGVIVNMMRKNPPKKSYSDSPLFARVRITKTPDELVEFEADVIRTAERIRLAYLRDHFPRTTDTINCVGGIGKSPCLFQGLCMSGLKPSIADPLAFTSIGIRTEVWAPWERSNETISRLTAQDHSTQASLWKHLYC